METPEHVYYPLEQTDLTWEDVGGLDQAKQELKDLFHHRKEDQEGFLASRSSEPTKWILSSTSGALLYGPPGCGKSLLARATANQFGAKLIWIKCPELLSIFISDESKTSEATSAGNSDVENRIRTLFDSARRLATPLNRRVLFFDDIETLCSPPPPLRDRINNQLYTELDASQANTNLIVVAASKQPQLINPRLLRPGRVSQHIFVPLPDLAARVEILKVVLRPLPVSPEIDPEYLASRLEGFTGADLVSVCHMACRKMINEAVEKERVKAQNGEENAGEAKGADEAQGDGRSKATQENLDACPQEPFITPQNFADAMTFARRSISEQDLKRFYNF